jgi:hypothetical protein
VVFSFDASFGLTWHMLTHVDYKISCLLTRANLTNVLDEGLRIGETGRRMNSKV